MKPGKLKILIERAKGFTLVELMIYIGLISIVLTLVTSFSISIARLRDEAYVMEEIGYNSRTVIGIISEKVRESGRIDLPQNGNATGTLQFAADVSASPDRIDLIDKAIYLTSFSGEFQRLTDNSVEVTSLSFMNTASSSKKANIEISFEMKGSNSGQAGNYAQKYETSVSMRK